MGGESTLPSDDLRFQPYGVERAGAGLWGFTEGLVLEPLEAAERSAIGFLAISACCNRGGERSVVAPLRCGRAVGGLMIQPRLWNAAQDQSGLLDRIGVGQRRCNG